MAATTEAVRHGTGATPTRLNFDVIKLRTAEILGISKEEASDAVIGDLVGMDRTTIWRNRTGRVVQTFETADKIAAGLDLTVAQVTAAPAPKAGE